MATSDHIRTLFRAFRKRDDPAFLDAAKALISEEQAKGHRLLAEDLQRLLNNGAAIGRVANYQPHEVPMDKERGLPLVHIEHPDSGWERLVLGRELKENVEGIVEEFRKREVLASYGIQAKKKVLFFGAPGCGKTVTAKAMAAVLDLPLLYVRFDSVVSSFLGETAANLRRIFDFASRGHWVILFDEFDAIGKGRDNPQEHGELKRVVNTLLQLMDGFAGESLLIAATNHPTLLDKAVWRRFDEVCRFDIPTAKEREALLRVFLGGFRHANANLGELARSKNIRHMTGDDLERICVEAIKDAILSGRNELSAEDLRKSLARQQKRVRSIEAGKESK